MTQYSGIPRQQTGKREGELVVIGLIIDRIYGTRRVPEEERRMLEEGEVIFSTEHGFGMRIPITGVSVYPRHRKLYHG